MRIRKLAPPDREAVLGILRSDGTFSDDEVTCALELIDLAVSQPGRDYLVQVCEDEGRIIGYICYGPTPMTLGTWDLYWVATHAQARGRGVARRLVEAMEEELRGGGARVIRLETSQMEAYGAARGLYDRLGYLEVGRITDFYKPGDDLLIFAKHLPAA
jgi:ribosomal protein S18 acetylase RimI-like enzyme